MSQRDELKFQGGAATKPEAEYGNEYGDGAIQDLWKPFFAVSSNLSDHKPPVHRRWLVWHAVRASGSVPGVLPTFVTNEGKLLVDGARMDNVPLGPMKGLEIRAERGCHPGS
jgi:predicted acylesterase/phospholipase RssA